MRPSGLGAGAGGAQGAVPVPTRRMALIIWWFLFGGVVVFAVVATAVGPTLWRQRGLGEVADVLAWVAVAMAVVGLLLSRLLPRRIQAPAGAPPDAVAVLRTVIAAALNEGAALFAVVAWMLGGRSLALGALAIAVAGLLLAFPSAARWQGLGGSAPRADRPNRLVR